MKDYAPCRSETRSMRLDDPTACAAIFNQHHGHSVLIHVGQIIRHFRALQGRIIRYDEAVDRERATALAVPWVSVAFQLVLGKSLVEAGTALIPEIVLCFADPLLHVRLSQKRTFFLFVNVHPRIVTLLLPRRYNRSIDETTRTVTSMV